MRFSVLRVESHHAAAPLEEIHLLTYSPSSYGFSVLSLLSHSDASYRPGRNAELEYINWFKRWSIFYQAS